MSLEEFYSNNKQHIVAIYQGGSGSFGVDSTHDIDYIIFFGNREDYNATQDAVERLKGSNAGVKVDVFIHYVNENHKPVFWSVQQRYWKLLFGKPVSVYDVLEHRDEQTVLLKRLVNTAKGKAWATIYVLAAVLQRNDYTLSDEDYTIIREIYSNGDATPEQKAAIRDIANAL